MPWGSVSFLDKIVDGYLAKLSRGARTGCGTGPTALDQLAFSPALKKLASEVCCAFRADREVSIAVNFAEMVDR